MCVRVLLFEP